MIDINDPKNDESHIKIMKKIENLEFLKVETDSTLKAILIRIDAMEK